MDAEFRHISLKYETPRKNRVLYNISQCYRNEIECYSSGANMVGSWVGTTLHQTARQLGSFYNFDASLCGVRK